MNLKKNMHKLKLIISETAIDDMAQIFEFVSKDNITAAQKLISSFKETFERLRNFPNSGVKKAKYIKRNIRVAIVAGHYQIVYSAKKDLLCIHRVLTGYQDICSKLL